MIQNDQVMHDKEWREIYGRIQQALQNFSEEPEGGVGDYFLIDEVIEPHAHYLELHKVRMLRPEVINLLSPVLVGFPHWQIKVFVISMQEKTIVDPDNGLLLRSDGIIDILDRTLLPPKYHRLRYEGSRPA